MSRRIAVFAVAGPVPPHGDERARPFRAANLATLCRLPCSGFVLLLDDDAITGFLIAAGRSHTHEQDEEEVEDT